MTANRLSVLIVLPLALGCQLVSVPQGLCFKDDGCDAGIGGGSGGGGGGGGGGAGGGGADAGPPLVATLAAAPTLDFGEVEVGQMVGKTLQIQNIGLTASGFLMVMPFSQPELQVVSGNCGLAIAPGASCSVDFLFAPEATTSSPFTAALQVTAQPGGTIDTSVRAKVMLRVTVQLNSPGPGSRVTNPDAGFACALGSPGCSALFEKGARVVLNSTTQNGSFTRLLHWQASTLDGGPAICEGQGLGFSVLTGHQCALAKLTQATNVAATFVSTTRNLVFLSSESMNGNLGGLIGADKKCNDLATAAGINTANEKGFVAWLSDGTNSAASRIAAPAGGFERMDNSPFQFTPFAYSRQDLLSDQILLPLNMDEQGKHQNVDDTLFAWTGTHANGGSVLANCNGWMSPSAGASAQVGRVQGGPGLWTNSGTTATCDRFGRLYCIQTSSTAPILIPAPAGKLIYFTNGPGFLPGGGLAAADAYCDLYRPSMMGPGFSALLSTSTTPARMRLDPGAFYFRVDGLFVGSGSSIETTSVAAIPWIRNDRTTAADAKVWTGATQPANTGQLATTCSDWMSTGGSGLATAINLGGQRWFVDGMLGGKPHPCNAAQQLLCVQK